MVVERPPFLDSVKGCQSIVYLSAPHVPAQMKETMGMVVCRVARPFTANPDPSKSISQGDMVRKML
jgi:hypothetical protein